MPDRDHSDEEGQRPSYVGKHPCEGCGAGYVECAQWHEFDAMCCGNCGHPTRWVEDPYTVDEVVEMWEGREKPPHVERWLAEHFGSSEPGVGS